MMMENARTSIIARRAFVDGLDPDGDGWLLTAADHLAVMDDEPVPTSYRTPWITSWRSRSTRAGH